MQPTELKSLKLSIPQEGIMLVQLDMPESSANVLTEQLFADLRIAWEIIEADPKIQGVVIISAKEKIFVAGADLHRIERTLDWESQAIRKFCEDGRDVFARFRSNHFPVVAAIHGACVGGGFELALWCDARICSDDRRTVFGLPEVKLGLVPGWAGTCLLPRMMSVELAAESTALAQLFPASQAHQWGLVDSLAPSEDLLASAIELIRRMNASEHWQDHRERMLGPADMPPVDPAATRKRILSRVAEREDIDPVAAEIVTDQILNTSAGSFADACEGETQAMCQVYGSENNAGRLASFFLNERARKMGAELVRSAPALPCQTIGILGAGQMGAGVAAVLQSHGLDVCLFDIDPQQATRAIELIGKLPDSRTDRIQIARTLSELADCDVVVEAISESLDAKRTLLMEVSQVVRPSAPVATNTSVIELKNLVESVAHPERFCGLHFCSPVQVSQLVEIVSHAATSATTLSTAATLVRAIRKNAVHLHDGPGFVVNRLLTPMFAEATRLLFAGNPLKMIDLAMREFGFPMGPFEIMDLIGNDVVSAAGRNMYLARPQLVFVSPLLPRMVKAGWLGHKTKIGFYDYRQYDSSLEVYATAQPHPLPELNREAVPLVESYQAKDMPASEPKVVQERLLLTMLLEACRLMDEGVADDVRDVDLCLQYGLRFPADRAGIFFWADRQGADWCVSRIEALARSTGDDRYRIPSRLSALVETQSKFYD